VVFALYFLAPIYVPIGLALACWTVWRNYKRFLFRTSQDRILLEIKVPKEITKTPLAMELFLNSIHQPGGEGSWYDRNFLGKSRTWFSLELVSIEGLVKFFIWTEKKFKPLLEAQMYAQYPEVEIYEVPDYTKSVSLDLNNQAMWGNEFILTKDDPNPIKTYVDYGLDKVGLKSEEITDPITPVIEFLGSIGKGEQLWIQILVRAHKKNFKEELSWSKRISELKWSGDDYDWTKKAKEEKKKLLEELKPDDEKPMRPPTKVESEIIESLERNITKLGFDCGIRGIYLTDKDKFNPINITGMTGTFKQYNSAHLNGFRPNRVTGFYYPWQDYKNYRLNKLKEDLFNDYKRRAYFYYPNTSDKQFVLSSEELATIFHLPGGVSRTPTFNRIESKKSEPPQNLPF
ncbi:hypothetical protein KKC45_03980, partial [Patescibacteria group bacterium]|nr:hypothetical protein [Patescibacteria group bacterium]